MKEIKIKPTDILRVKYYDTTKTRGYVYVNDELIGTCTIGKKC